MTKAHTDLAQFDFHAGYTVEPQLRHLGRSRNHIHLTHPRIAGNFDASDLSATHRDFAGLAARERRSANAHLNFIKAGRNEDVEVAVCIGQFARHQRALSVARNCTTAPDRGDAALSPAR